MQASMEVLSYRIENSVNGDLLDRVVIDDVHLESSIDGLIIRFIRGCNSTYVIARNQSWNHWGQLCFSRSMGDGIVQRFKVTFKLSPMLASVE